MKKKLVYVIFTMVGLFVIQSFASKLGGLVADLFDYSVLDKDNTFMWVSVHHIVQMLLAVVLIVIVHKVTKINFYLKPKVDKVGIKYTVIFGVIILVYVLVSYGVGYAMNTIASYGYELNTLNVFGTLGFQLLLSGTSEELLFRALPITVLVAILHEKETNKSNIAIVIASVLFSVAHISWTISPLTISFSWFQLIYAFVLGLAYGVTYVKSKSIIYPMVMHGLSNFFMVGVGYVFFCLMG